MWFILTLLVIQAWVCAFTEGLLLLLELQSWRLSLLLEDRGGPAASLSSLSAGQHPRHGRAEHSLHGQSPQHPSALHEMLALEEGGAEALYLVGVFFPIGLAVLQGGEYTFSFLIFEIKNALSNAKNQSLKQ